jgi:hypothetical protein
MQAEAGGGLGGRSRRDLDGIIAETHLRMPDRRRQVDFSQSIASARKNAPTVADFAEHVLSEISGGGRLVFLGGACRLPYLAARRLASKHRVRREDVILLDMPEKTLEAAAPGQAEEYMRQRGLFQGPCTLIDNGMEGTVCKKLMKIIADAGGPTARPYLMYSSAEGVDGYNKSLPEGKRQAVLEAAHFLERCARSRAIGQLVEDGSGVHPRYERPRGPQMPEFAEDDNKESHWYDPKTAWLISRLILAEAGKRTG